MHMYPLVHTPAAWKSARAASSAEAASCPSSDRDRKAVPAVCAWRAEMHGVCMRGCGCANACLHTARSNMLRCDAVQCGAAHVCLELPNCRVELVLDRAVRTHCVQACVCACVRAYMREHTGVHKHARASAPVNACMRACARGRVRRCTTLVHFLLQHCQALANVFLCMDVRICMDKLHYVALHCVV